MKNKSFLLIMSISLLILTSCSNNNEQKDYVSEVKSEKCCSADKEKESEKCCSADKEKESEKSCSADKAKESEKCCSSNKKEKSCSDNKIEEKDDKSCESSSENIEV